MKGEREKREGERGGREKGAEGSSSEHLRCPEAEKKIQLHPSQPQGAGRRFTSMIERQRKKAPSGGTAHTR